MKTKLDKLFDFTVRLYLSLGESIGCENGVIKLKSSIELTEENVTYLSYLQKNRSKFRKFTLEIDYEGAESRNIRVNEECTSLVIELQTNKGCNFSFFKSEKEFFQDLSVYLIQGCELPKSFYLIDENYRSDSELKLPSITKLKSISRWIDFLKKISDIEKNTDNGVALYYFIKGEDDKYAKPLKLEITNLEELVHLDSISPVDDVEKLVSEDENGNLHHRDRQSFFKLALVDTLKPEFSEVADGQSKSVILFGLLPEIKNKYFDHYDVFIHNFAIGEFQQQVEEKGFDYSEKISAVLNDIQIRLYAIPVVLVSLGALAKVDNIFSYLFILAGVLITALFNTWMINDQRLRLEQIRKSFKFTFGKLKKQGQEKLEENEILSNLNEISKNIEDRIKDRNTKISYYKFFCWVPTLITIFLFLIKEKVAIFNYFDLGEKLSSPTLEHIYCFILGMVEIILFFS